MNRQPMRRCGKQYATPAQALSSKRGQAPGAEVTSCRCGAYHLTVPRTRGDGKVKASVSGNTIPPQVCRQVGKRDGRRCVRCCSARNLHRHHRRIKGHGGDSRPHTDCACNIITLCDECHRWVHSARGRREAEKLGLILSRYERRPWSRPVTVRGEDGTAAERWLACGGAYVNEPGERAA
jgi:hypothetical protein